ncbi:MAG: 6-phosphogluconolactonase [Candidatus Omnitrophica bacterium]|nr:6-phosphogluconolactonase [Candidatus Omnitrophota bacterium]
MAAQAKVLIFESPYAAANYLLKKWQEIAQWAVVDHQLFNVALSGGRTPAEFYCRLCALENYGLWQRTHLFPGDERFVPANDKDSNFRMIKSNLLDYIHIPPQNVHPVPTNGKNAAVAAEEYKNILMDHFADQHKPLPRFDLILLGIGEDGHTASLFPGMEQQTRDPDIAVMPVSLPHLKTDRVSLSLPVINSASNVVVLVLGVTKAGIIQKILEDNYPCPAAQVNPTGGRLTFVLDKEAAGKLSRPLTYLQEDDALCLKTS